MSRNERKRDMSRYLTFKDLKAMGWPLSSSRTMQLVAAGKFPEPRKFSEGQQARSFWLSDDVASFLPGGVTPASE